MKKIAFIGAGSFGFTRNLVRDLLTFDAFQDCTISLMDIDPDRLSYIERAVKRLVAEKNCDVKVEATADRAKALEGADGVLITILAGGVHVWRYDVEIPMEYGVDINVGDTRGPAGIFRALRTIPVMLDICRDIEKYAPNAIVLNYTNPMAMLCRAMQSETSLQITGLCHSVQKTAGMLARWIGAPMEEITYLCAGINHQAHYLEYRWNGKDAYPLIRKAVEEREEVYREEKVRNEVFKHLGYYVTESSGHDSEYNPWFRKRKDLIEKYCIGSTGWNSGEHAYILKTYLEREDTWKKDMDEWFEQPVDFARGDEYASHIFNAVFGDNRIFEFNGNVRNFGLIDNLPYGCCVEIPVVASKRGLVPTKVGKLSPQLAVLNNVNAMCEEMAVEGALSGNKDLIYQAIYHDPLTSAVLGLAEIKEMTDAMFEKNKEYLKDMF